MACINWRIGFQLEAQEVAEHMLGHSSAFVAGTAVSWDWQSLAVQQVRVLHGRAWQCHKVYGRLCSDFSLWHM